MVKGLCESTKGVWSRDVDLSDGRLQKLYRDHLHVNQLEFINGVGVNDRAGRDVVKSDLEEMLHNLAEHVEFCRNHKLCLHSF